MLISYELPRLRRITCDSESQVTTYSTIHSTISNLELIVDIMGVAGSDSADAADALHARPKAPGLGQM